LLGEAIDFETHGNFEHAAFLRTNGMVHECYLPHVRDRALIPEEIQYIRVFSLFRADDFEARFEANFDWNLKADIQYSVLDLFRFLFNVPDCDEKHTFCSRYVFHTIGLVAPYLLPLTRVQAHDWISPRDLSISTRLIPDLDRQACLPDIKA
jgi:hypothetical protein